MSSEIGTNYHPSIQIIKKLLLKIRKDLTIGTNKSRKSKLKLNEALEMAGAFGPFGGEVITAWFGGPAA